MDTSYQKRLAARVLKCGPSRVKVSQAKEIEEALTRSDVRKLIVKGLIVKVQKKGTSRVKANFIASQKKKGRRRGRGKRSGTRYSRQPRKETWMKTVRALRRLLKELKENGKIENSVYLDCYRKAKGGFFRNRKHLLSWLKDNKMIKTGKNGEKSER